MVQAIDELVRKTFQEWTSTLDKDSIRRLDTPLLRISQEKAGMLDVNFDKYRTHPGSFSLSLVPVPSPTPFKSLTFIFSLYSSVCLHLSYCDICYFSLFVLLTQGPAM
jgi:hypothetical protein